MSEPNVVFNLEMFRNRKIVTRVEAEGYESLLRHAHDFVETVYVLDGEARHCIGEEETKIKKGDFLIVQPGTSHCYVPKYSNSKFHIENFIFDKDLFPFLHNYPCITVRHVGEDSAMAGLISVLEIECADHAKQNDEILRHIMHALLLNVIYRFSNVAKSSSISEGLCDEICEYIKQNSEKELTLDAIAGRFYCSKNTIVTLFRKNYNTTVYHYILKIRIEKACELLISSDLSNHAICEMVGFSDFRNFYRHFKKLVGMTPKAYKEQVEKEDKV